MNGIDLTFSEEKKKLPVGASKIFGNPDVWDGFEWPQFTENGESYDFTFVCQVNCAETAPFDKNDILPKSGVLYFFYDMDGMPEESSDKNAAKIIYYDGELSSLYEMLRTDHEGNDMSLPEMKIHFDSSGNIGGVLCGAPVHGQQPLLQIRSFETDNIKINFLGGGVLCFSVPQSNLINGDFSNIHIRYIKE